MEIIRLQPFPLTFTQGDLQPNTEYVVAILDDHAIDLVEIPATSNEDGVIEVTLPDYFSKYDSEYSLEIFENIEEDPNLPMIRGDLVLIDTLTIMRPYINPILLAETEDDIEQAKMYEAIARAIINSITGGFMYERKTVETTGFGSDYLPVPFRLNRIVRVYENDVLVYDEFPTDENWVNIKSYYITPDKAAITVGPISSYGINRRQYKPVFGRNAGSDSFTLYNTNDSPNYSDAIYDTKTFIDLTGNNSFFPNGWDYTVEIEAGWPIIPQDIKQATMLLVNDLRCNNIPYINSYIKDYKSDQFTLSFDPGVFKDTGNRIADKILSAYVRPIYRLGVL